MWSLSASLALRHTNTYYVWKKLAKFMHSYSVFHPSMEHLCSIAFLLLKFLEFCVLWGHWNLRFSLNFRKCVRAVDTNTIFKLFFAFVYFLLSVAQFWLEIFRKFQNFDIFKPQMNVLSPPEQKTPTVDFCSFSGISTKNKTDRKSAKL